MKRLTILVLTVCFVLSLFASGQIADTLIYNRSKRYLHTYPLEPYFEKYPDKRPKTKSSCTGLWRHYVATYEIKNNQLYLIDIQTMIVNKSGSFTYKSVINKIFPNSKTTKAVWFTGVMVVCYGKIIEYETFDHAVYENNILIEVENGNVIKETRINN